MNPFGADPPTLFRYTGQAEGAIPNDARVRKSRAEEGDAHAIGAEGTVRGSIAVPDEVADEINHPDFASDYAYFIEWDDAPGIHVGTLGAKIEPIEKGW